MDYDPMLTLNENLMINGLTAVERISSPEYTRDIIDDSGAVVLKEKLAHEVTDWLKSQVVRAVTHDGGPDRIDGAPSDGDIL